ATATANSHFPDIGALSGIGLIVFMIDPAGSRSARHVGRGLFMGSARLVAVSGLGPKEPAAFVVEADGRRLLLDCGEGSEPGRLPDFDAIGNIHAVILSHGHADHAGALRFSDRIGRPPVYATAPVLARLKGIAGHAIPI